MASSLAELTTRYGGGLNLVDAPTEMRPDQCRVLQNFRITGEGRVGTRKAAVSLTTLTGEIVAVFPYNHTGSVGAVLLVWNGSSSVTLQTVNGSGGGVSSVGTLPGYGSGISSRPTFHGAVLGRVLFMCDEAKSVGLVCYDPNDVLGSGSAMFAPTFDFNQDATFAVAKPRIVVEHLNHLWMFGYGDEADADRGEVGRFSFLGLLDDQQGSGDAGDGGATGSADLFDVGDAVGAAPRGEDVVAAASGNGRLVVASERQAWVVYGSGRDSWRRDPIDNQRGCVSSRAMVEADGVVYWLSPLGPCRYRGGGVVEDLSRQVDPLMAEVDAASVFAAHHPEENQVRWYYSRRDDSTDGANRLLAWNYLEETFEGPDVLGVRAFSAGYLLPSGDEAPTAAPSSLTHPTGGITPSSAKATWVNGDSAPGTKTTVERAPDSGGSPGTYMAVGTLDAGAGEFIHTGLASGTAYWTRVKHIRNGQSTATVQATFTTLTAGTLPVPTNLSASDSAVFSGGAWYASVLLAVDLPEVAGGVRVRWERDTGSGYVQIARTDVGVASYRDNGVSSGVSTTYRARIEDEAGNLSGYSSTANVTPTTDPYSDWPDDLL